MKRSIILAVGFGGLLMAQKGKTGGHGLGGDLPTASEKSSARATLPANSSASNASMTAGARLANNAALSARIQPLVPAGSTVATASAGFRNTGEFIAALHVSRNLTIPFDQLKAKLTGSKPESLGQAIHGLRPDLSRGTVKSDVRTAERQVDQDIDSAMLANRFSTNATLSARAQALLPAGSNLQTAAAGFENARQFLLTEHVARDLNIPFAQLKTKVTGTNAVSPEDAISSLRPDLSRATIRSELKVARQETKTDLQASHISSEEIAEAK